MECKNHALRATFFVCFQPVVCKSNSGFRFGPKKPESGFRFEKKVVDLSLHSNPYSDLLGLDHSPGLIIRDV